MCIICSSLLSPFRNFNLSSYDADDLLTDSRYFCAVHSLIDEWNKKQHVCLWMPEYSSVTWYVYSSDTDEKRHVCIFTVDFKWIQRYTKERNRIQMWIFTGDWMSPIGKKTSEFAECALKLLLFFNTKTRHKSITT